MKILKAIKIWKYIVCVVSANGPMDRDNLILTKIILT